MNNFNYSPAESTHDAVSLVAQNERAAFLAGGTNIIDLWKYNLTGFDTLVDVSKLKVDNIIEENTAGGVRLGAFMTNADTAYHPLIESRYPLLSKAILAGASAQIRNMATNGGNLLQRTRCYYFYDQHTPCNKREPGSGCSAINGYNRMHAILGASDQCIAVFPSDMCVALAALDAVVNVEGPGGARKINFEDFHRLPGDSPQRDNNLQHAELITSIELPPEGFSKNYSYLKLRDRNSYAFAMISVANAFDFTDGVIKEARIALGGVAHKPWRVKEAEQFLVDKEPSEKNFLDAANIILNGAQGYPHNSFKIEMSRKAIVRNSMMALHPETQLQGAKPSA